VVIVKVSGVAAGEPVFQPAVNDKVWDPFTRVAGVDRAQVNVAYAVGTTGFGHVPTAVAAVFSTVQE